MDNKIRLCLAVMTTADAEDNLKTLFNSIVAMKGKLAGHAIDVKSIVFYDDRSIRGMLPEVPTNYVAKFKFIDFGQARTDVLREAFEHASKPDVVMMLDNDFEIELLDAYTFMSSVYTIHNMERDGNIWYSGDFKYYQALMFSGPRTYKGRTHEFPITVHAELVSGISIKHNCNSPSRANKFKRDIELLNADISDHGHQSYLGQRATMYLANTLVDEFMAKKLANSEVNDNGIHIHIFDLYRKIFKADLLSLDDKRYSVAVFFRYIKAIYDSNTMFTISRRDLVDMCLLSNETLRYSRDAGMYIDDAVNAISVLFISFHDPGLFLNVFPNAGAIYDYYESETSYFTSGLYEKYCSKINLGLACYHNGWKKIAKNIWSDMLSPKIYDEFKDVAMLKHNLVFVQDKTYTVDIESATSNIVAEKYFVKDPKAAAVVSKIKALFAHLKTMEDVNLNELWNT